MSAELSPRPSDPNEGYFYTVSNGSMQLFKDNKLSEFSNVLPHSLTNSSQSYELALLEIIFNNEFLFPNLPADDHIPSFILTQETDYIDKVKFSHYSGDAQFFLPRQHYSLWKFIRILETISSSGLRDKSDAPIIAAFSPELQLPLMGLFHNNKSEPWTASVKNYKLMVYKPLADLIVSSTPVQNQKNSLEASINIDGSTYNVYGLLPGTHYFFAITRSWQRIPSHFEPSVFIECPSIDHHLFNNTLVAQLGHCGIPEHMTAGGAKGFHLEILKPTYFTLSTNKLQAVHVKLCDKNGNRLKLAPGPSTILKFHLRRVIQEERMNSHFVQVTSKAQTGVGTNNANKFTVQLPFPLQLHSDSFLGQWKVGISSAIIPSRFKLTLSEESRIINIHFHQVETFTLILPHHSTLNEVCDFLNNNTKSFLLAEEDSLTGGLRLTPQHTMNITMRSVLYNFLGGSVSDIEAEPIVQIRRLPEQPFVFPRPPRYEKEFPTSAFVYANFIEPSIVAGQFLRILRIISLSTNHKHGRHHLVKDFKHLEMHNVTTSRLQTLSFELRSHDGTPLDFQDQSSEVMFNLVFQRQK